MTTMVRITKTCSVCGRESEHRVIASTNSFGSPDLDLRPPQMRRSTMPWWHQVCPHCGYVATRITEPTKATVDWLASDAYLGLDGVLDDTAPGLALEFYREHKVELLDGKPRDAAQTLLRAAWCCDDERLDAEARALRERCLAVLDEAIAGGLQLTEDEQLQRADIMRRAGHLDELCCEYHEGMFGGDLINQLVAFELACARRGDTGCYTVREAVGKA